MIEFKLEHAEYIELNQLLKVTRLCDSGGMANNFISGGKVKVDGHMELRKRCKIRAGQVVEFNGQSITVKSSAA